MSDWLKLSKEDAELFRSCHEDENVVLLDERWQKMPQKTIGLMMMDAYRRASEDALKGLSVDYETVLDPVNPHARYTLRIRGGYTDLHLDYDIESESACCIVTLNDGRTGKGFAKLKRLRPQ
ncbi:MAG TPA: hypothetical protein VM619_02515 [Luteimonas sp.]|nr:hypothetical protein [Luteimonas sp.]